MSGLLPDEKLRLYMFIFARPSCVILTNCWHLIRSYIYLQLPRLLKKDAIARYYGFEKGQVVKVMYDGEITQSHVTYRCVW